MFEMPFVLTLWVQCGHLAAGGLETEMKFLPNSGRDGQPLVPAAPFPSIASDRVAELLRQCPAAAETPLVDASGLLPEGKLHIKDERGRMGLGSFKALGAAYVIAREAFELDPNPGADTLTGRTYVTASAGNHGMSVAAGARIFGADAVVFIAQTVPDSFAQRLQGKGATVLREGVDYAASMQAAEKAAHDRGWTLLSDSSWTGYTQVPYTLMEGYLQMAAEAEMQIETPPTHIFLQAGVGGMAGAVAAYARHIWGGGPHITVVEPDAAPALQASVEAGKPVFADGPDSSMGRLDCKEPSHIALNGLARDADAFLTLSDAEVEAHLPALAETGLATSPSGAAGVAALMRADVRERIGFGARSTALCFLSEGPA